MCPTNFCDYCGCAHLYQVTHALQGLPWSFQCQISSCFTENTLRVDHQPTNRAKHYAVFSENPMKYTDAQCKQYIEFVNAAEGGTYSYYWASKV